MLVTGLAWGPQAPGVDWLPTATLTALGSALFGSSLAAIGTVAGHAMWRRYSTLVAAEGPSRVVVVVAAALLAPTVAGFSVAAAAAFLPGAATLLLWPTLRRQSFSMKSDAATRETITRMLRAMLASGISGVLLIGWPAL